MIEAAGRGRSEAEIEAVREDLGTAERRCFHEAQALAHTLGGRRA